MVLICRFAQGSTLGITLTSPTLIAPSQAGPAASEPKDGEDRDHLFTTHLYGAVKKGTDPPFDYIINVFE